MRLRDALTTAIDYIRTTAPDDADLRKVATALERKAERMRASQEKSSIWPDRCHCGERRERRMLVCAICYPGIPMRLIMSAQLGKSRERKRALNQIRLACETRGIQAEEAA